MCSYTWCHIPTLCFAFSPSQRSQELQLPCAALLNAAAAVQILAWKPSPDHGPHGNFQAKMISLTTGRRPHFCKALSTEFTVSWIMSQSTTICSLRLYFKYAINAILSGPWGVKTTVNQCVTKRCCVHLCFKAKMWARSIDSTSIGRGCARGPSLSEQAEKERC